MNIAIFYNYTYTFPLISLYKTDNSRFLGYVFIFSAFGHNQIKNRFEYPGGGGRLMTSKNVRSGEGGTSPVHKLLGNFRLLRQLSTS